MINLIFNNVPHESGNKKTLNLVTDYCMVTWDVIFEFLQDKTNILSKKFKIFVKNNYYTLNDLKLSFSETFKYNEFMNFDVKVS